MDIILLFASIIESLDQVLILLWKIILYNNLCYGGYFR